MLKSDFIKLFRAVSENQTKPQGFKYNAKGAEGFEYVKKGNDNIIYKVGFHIVTKFDFVKDTNGYIVEPWFSPNSALENILYIGAINPNA